jgi:hypothetical protein
MNDAAARARVADIRALLNPPPFPFPPARIGEHIYHSLGISCHPQLPHRPGTSQSG